MVSKDTLKKNYVSIDDERGGHGAEAKKWLEKWHFSNKNDSWNGIFQTKMALFIDEKGDGAEADDAVVEGVWLPPWQELPMMEHNDKSAPTGKLKKYIGIYWNCFWMYLNTYIHFTIRYDLQSGMYNFTWLQVTKFKKYKSLHPKVR